MQNQVKGEARTVLVVGHDNPEKYQSIYGYQKRRFYAKTMIYKDGEFVLGNGGVGAIKEEPVPVPGKPNQVVFYSHNSGRKQGQPRFFQTPEDLLRAHGHVVADSGSEEDMRKALEDFNGGPLPKAGEATNGAEQDPKPEYEEDFSDLSPRQKQHAKKLADEAKAASKKFYGYVDKAREGSSPRKSASK